MAHPDTPKGDSKQSTRPTGARAIPVTPASAKPGKSKRAGRATQAAEEAIRRATRPDGGVGGQSGTGQHQPHHRVEDDEGSHAASSPPSGTTVLPEPPSGPGYQSGGRGTDREQRVTERKQRESGVGKTMEQGPGMDPPPGAPSHRRH